MRLNSVAHKLRTQPSYFFGRFYSLRKAYSKSKGLKAYSPIKYVKEKIFNVNVENLVKDLRSNAVAFGINLPDNYVQEILEFSKKSRLKRWGWTEGKTFQLEDVENGKINRENVAIAEVWDKKELKLLDEIAHDPEMLEVARKYLGYNDVQIDIRLFWTFSGNMSDEERIRSNQTIEYHFDVHSWNFCYLHFYITDTDAESGAHQMIKKSHKDKKMNWLWGSAKKSEEEIKNYYPKEDILTIEGKAGTGFFEDTSCYHRGVAPRKGNRLLLQIRYF